MTRLQLWALAACALFLCGCGTDDPTADPKTTQAKEPCCSDELGTGEVGDESLYQLDSTWTDQDGRAHQLLEFRGRKRIVAMIFTNCSYACPLTMVTLKRIESQLASSQAGAARKAAFLLFSLDPDRDTPQAMKAYAVKEGLDLSRWTLLRSDAGAVREMAAVLGISFKRNTDGNIAHSNLITLLDESGTIEHRLAGLNADPAPLVAAVLKKRQ